MGLRLTMKKIGVIYYMKNSSIRGNEMKEF